MKTSKTSETLKWWKVREIASFCKELGTQTKLFFCLLLNSIFCKGSHDDMLITLYRSDDHFSKLGSVIHVNWLVTSYLYVIKVNCHLVRSSQLKLNPEIFKRTVNDQYIGINQLRLIFYDYSHLSQARFFKIYLEKDTDWQRIPVKTNDFQKMNRVDLEDLTENKWFW